MIRAGATGCAIGKLGHHRRRPDVTDANLHPGPSNAFREFTLGALRDAADYPRARALNC